MLLRESLSLRGIMLMNKKICTIIISVVCIFAIIAVSIGYMFKQGIISIDNSLYSQISQSVSNTEQSNSESQYEFGYPIYQILLREGAEYNVQYSDERYETDEYADIYVKYNSLEVSKEIGDFDLVDDWDDVKDENGTIINDYSYVICNTTIINKGRFNLETGINYMHLYFGTDINYTSMRSFNSGKSDTYTKDYFLVNFEPNVEYNYNLVYIVEDDIIEKYGSDMLICAGFTESFQETFPIVDKK